MVEEDLDKFLNLMNLENSHGCFFKENWNLIALFIAINYIPSVGSENEINNT